MNDAAIVEVAGRRNLYAWISLGLAIVGLLATGVGGPFGGLIAVPALFLGAKGLWAAETLGRGRAVSVVGIVIGSVASLEFLAALGAGPNPMLGVAIFFVAFAPFVLLYMYGLKVALDRCSMESRTVAPGKVWLLLIPYYNLIWHFFVVSHVAKSLDTEFKKRNLPNAGTMPGKSLGAAMCTLILIGIIPSFVVAIFFLFPTNSITSRFDLSPDLLLIPALLWFATLIAAIDCWIVYWTKIEFWSDALRRAGETEELNELGQQAEQS